MQMDNCENTLESHPWFADKFNNIREQEHVVYMRFTRLGIFYKNTHYFFTGTKTELNNFMLERKKEIDEAKKELGFGRGDHDNLWDTPLWGFRPPTTNLVEDGFENGFEDGFERAESFAEPLSNWKLYLYADEEEFNSALHLLENQTQEQCNSFPNEIIYINQAKK